MGGGNGTLYCYRKLSFGFPERIRHKEEVESFLLEHDFATEKWMNEKYLIDYRVQVLDGTPRVQILLHKENLAAYDKFEIKQYITEDIFNIDDPADIDFTPNEFGKGPFDRYEENMDRQPENVNNGSEGRIILLTILIDFL